MPWEIQTVTMIRDEFVVMAKNSQISFSELCARYKISRKTGYKWLERYESEGKSGLNNRSKAPLAVPSKTGKDIEERVVSVRLKYPAWGGRKIRRHLQDIGHAEVPASSTITDILHRYGLIKEEVSDRSRPWKRFVHEKPNDLWQMDFKGHFPMNDGLRCHPLTIVDDHSRFAIDITACLNERGATVQNAMTRVFEQYGLPKAINVDNGPPWGSIFEICRYTSFGIWLIDQGVILSHSRPRHPQTNGKNERFNRTLKAEVIDCSYIDSMTHAQSLFNDWRHVYNFIRPHEAIDYQTPSKLYSPSYRQYKQQMEEYDYSKDYISYIVDNRGRVSLEGRTLFVGVPFAKKTIGLRFTEEACDTIDIYYRHQRLARFDLSKVARGDYANVYGDLG